jgi:hypothetical protein
MGNDIRTAMAKAGLISEKKAKEVDAKLEAHAEAIKIQKEEQSLRRREVAQVHRELGYELAINRKGKRLSYLDWYIFKSAPSRRENICCHCGEVGLSSQAFAAKLFDGAKAREAANITPIGSKANNYVDRMVSHIVDEALSTNLNSNLIVWDRFLSSLCFPERIRDFLHDLGPLSYCIACRNHILKAFL